MKPIYTATHDEQALAQEWHDGQGSALYAVASTGSLTPGAEWRDTPRGRADLAHGLYRELWRDAIDADAAGLDDHHAIMVEWLRKLENLTDTLEELADDDDELKAIADTAAGDYCSTCDIPACDGQCANVSKVEA
jgi:hypothetical protein